MVANHCSIDAVFMNEISSCPPSAYSGALAANRHGLPRCARHEAAGHALFMAPLCVLVRRKR